MDLRIPGGEIVCILNSVNHLLLAYLNLKEHLELDVKIQRST